MKVNKIAVARTGYVGLSLDVLLVQWNRGVAVDININQIKKASAKYNINL